MFWHYPAIISYLREEDMSLKLVQVGNSLPVSYPVDTAAEFEPGMIGQLYLRGNQIVCGVSDGRAPFGIIDDFKTRAFTAPSIDEEVIASAPAVQQGGRLVTPIDVKWELRNPNIIPSSFITSPVDVALVPRNGVVVFPAGTPLNFDLDGDGVPDSIRTVVSYTYQIPNVSGDDSTMGSGKITIWFQRGIFQTDMYETNQRYPVNAILFVSENGKLTRSQPNDDYPGVAMVTGPPTAALGSLEFQWL
jgi:hypothetical protein